jgi:hypothetical protein
MGPTRPSSPRVSRTSEASTAECLVSAAMRTGGVEPPQPEATRLQRAELTSAQRPQVSSAGGIRTHGLELMRLARTAPPLPREVWLAGVEPAISGAQNRRGGLLPYSQATSCASHDSARADSWRAKIPEGGPLRGPRWERFPSPTEPGAALAAPGRSTTVESNHAPPPYQSGACPAGPSSKGTSRRRQGIAPCLPGSRPGGSLLAVRRSLAGRSRTPVRPR